jgi:hypothetical protein
MGKKILGCFILILAVSGCKNEDKENGDDINGKTSVTIENQASATFKVIDKKKNDLRVSFTGDVADNSCVINEPSKQKDFPQKFTMNIQNSDGSLQVISPNMSAKNYSRLYNAVVKAQLGQIGGGLSSTSPTDVVGASSAISIVTEYQNMSVQLATSGTDTFESNKCSLVIDGYTLFDNGRDGVQFSISCPVEPPSDYSRLEGSTACQIQIEADDDDSN